MPEPGASVPQPALAKCAPGLEEEVEGPAPVAPVPRDMVGVASVVVAARRGALDDPRDFCGDQAGVRRGELEGPRKTSVWRLGYPRDVWAKTPAV